MLRMTLLLLALLPLQACGDPGTPSPKLPDAVATEAVTPEAMTREAVTPEAMASPLRKQIIAMLPEAWVDGIVAMGQGDRQDYWLRLAASMRLGEYALASDTAAAPLRTKLKGLLAVFEQDLPPLADPRYPSGAFKESKAHVWEVLRNNRR